jgi:hypothetical protein
MKMRNQEVTPGVVGSGYALWKPANCPPMDEWMEKQNVSHQCNGLLDSLKQEAVLIHGTTWMHLEDMLSKISQSPKINTICFQLYETSKSV